MLPGVPDGFFMILRQCVCLKFRHICENTNVGVTLVESDEFSMMLIEVICPNPQKKCANTNLGVTFFGPDGFSIILMKSISSDGK